MTIEQLNKISLPNEQIICDINRRQCFLVIYDIKNCNPNGDPDANNAPRKNQFNNIGQASEVSLRRGIRDWVMNFLDGLEGFDIYYRHGEALLGKNNKFRKHRFAEAKKAAEAQIADQIIQAKTGEQNKATSDKSENKNGKSGKPGKPEKPVKVTLTEREIFSVMNRLYWDNRMFGCVYNGKDTDTKVNRLEKKNQKDNSSSVKSDSEDNNDESKTSEETNENVVVPSSGEQQQDKSDAKAKGYSVEYGMAANNSWAESVTPIYPTEHRIGRVVHHEKDDTGMLAPLWKIDHAVYTFPGRIDNYNLKKNGASSFDLKVYWCGLINMFHSRNNSLSRGGQTIRHIYVFSYDDDYSFISEASLLERIEVKVKDGIEYPGRWKDYEVTGGTDPELKGITFTKLY